MWRFRKSFVPGATVRITMYPNGVSTSVGIGFHTAVVNSYVCGDSVSLAPAPQADPRRAAGESQSTHEGGAERKVVTTLGLSEFERLLNEVWNEHAEIAKELVAVSEQEKMTGQKYLRWSRGWLLRYLFKARFASLQEAAEEATARRKELEEQKELARLYTEIDVSDSVKVAFSRFSDAFSSLSLSKQVWNIVSRETVDQLSERTLATEAIERIPVRFKLGGCPFIRSDWYVPYLRAVNGSSLYFYPSFVVHLSIELKVIMLEYKDVELDSQGVRFHEEGGVPSDSCVVGKTWARTNKKGGPDRRFNENYEIPIAEYGRLVFRTAAGLKEEYYVSNVAASDEFDKAWNSMIKSMNDANGDSTKIDQLVQHARHSTPPSNCEVFEVDEMYDEAVACVLADGRASISYVQRKLRIGYNRAARLLEEMEKAGIVSAMSPEGLRVILVS